MVDCSDRGKARILPSLRLASGHLMATWRPLSSFEGGASAGLVVFAGLFMAVLRLLCGHSLASLWCAASTWPLSSLFVACGWLHGGSFVVLSPSLTPRYVNLRPMGVLKMKLYKLGVPIWRASGDKISARTNNAKVILC